MAVVRDAARGAWYLDAAPATVVAWLVRLHWSRGAVNVLVLVASIVLPGGDFPLRRLAPLVAAAALIQADLALRVGRGQRIPPAITGAAIAIDVVLLTGLLELSGGPSNPFSVIYLVQVVLGWAALGGGWASAVGAWATLCYGVLIYWHLGELVPSHHRLIDFPTHLFTMWLAVAVMAELIGHFVREASAAIARRESQLEQMRAESARRERLMSLTTLAAGAAHELSTPLATIAVASRELERELLAVPAQPSWASDARLIREQVDRCHSILDQMSGRAGGNSADLEEPTDIASVFKDLCQRLPPEQAQRMRVRVEPSLGPIVVPRAGLLQVLLSLVKNAFDATDAGRPVTLEGLRMERRVRLIVRDEGPGMPAEVLRRAGEPFYTTKEPGRGFGLGLFLARMFAERCGGTLTLQSDHGTIAILELPLSSEPSGTA
jgi:two-component system, sensor histidine kinase RegB